MPITLSVRNADLVRFRFALSPIWETLAAVRTLLLPARHAVQLPWLRAVEAHRGDAAASVLAALLPERGYVPDFLTPPPTSPLACIDEELARVRRTPRGRVVAELRRATGRRAHPQLQRWIEEPARGAHEAADLIEKWWQRIVAQDWARIRDTLDADIAYRAGRMTQGGLAAVTEDLHVSVGWADSRLTVAGASGRGVLGGRGLVLMPSVFGWPSVKVILDRPWQPTLIYPARGVGDLWQPAVRTTDSSLAALLGPTRARVLAAVGEPISTTNLAARLGMSPATVSSHLGVLRRAGLLAAHRVGHQVRYSRSALGHQLVL
jgi:hypothetical protein